MALQQLHGPISTTFDPEDTTFTPVDSGYKPYSMAYHDAVGLFGQVTTAMGATFGYSTTCVANFDGVMYMRKYRASALAAVEMFNDMTTNKFIGWLTAFGGPRLIEPITTEWTEINLNSIPATYRGIRTPAGWYTIVPAPSNTLQRAPLDATDDGDFSVEYTFSPTLTQGTDPKLWEGPDNTFWIYTDDASGTIAQYDYIQKTEVFPNPNTTNRLTLGVQVDQLFYSRKFDIFITVEQNPLNSDITDIRVWSREMVPNALSAPTASPAITQGNVSVISTTLTDDNNVGIPDRLIDWSITAGNGTLLDTQSVTDADGVATTKYRALTSGGVDPTIEASLTY